MHKPVAIAICIILSGCAAKSSVRLAAKDQPSLSAHAEPVCLLRSPLPGDIKYSSIGTIKSSKKTYGSVSELIPLMAADARAIGADAIINMNTGQQMGLLAWSRPVGTGTAVKLADKASLNCLALGGELR